MGIFIFIESMVQTQIVSQFMGQGYIGVRSIVISGRGILIKVEAVDGNSVRIAQVRVLQAVIFHRLKPFQIVRTFDRQRQVGNA